MSDQVQVWPIKSALSESKSPEPGWDARRELQVDQVVIETVRPWMRCMLFEPGLVLVHEPVIGGGADRGELFPCYVGVALELAQEPLTRERDSLLGAATGATN